MAGIRTRFSVVADQAAERKRLRPRSREDRRKEKVEIRNGTKDRGERFCAVLSVNRSQSLGKSTESSDVSAAQRNVISEK